MIKLPEELKAIKELAEECMEKYVGKGYLVGDPNGVIDTIHDQQTLRISWPPLALDVNLLNNFHKAHFEFSRVYEDRKMYPSKDTSFYLSVVPKEVWGEVTTQYIPTIRIPLVSEKVIREFLLLKNEELFE